MHRTALMHAAAEDLSEIARVLVDAGADVDAVNEVRTGTVTSLPS